MLGICWCFNFIADRLLPLIYLIYFHELFFWLFGVIQIFDQLLVLDIQPETSSWAVTTTLLDVSCMMFSIILIPSLKRFQNQFHLRISNLQDMLRRKLWRPSNLFTVRGGIIAPANVSFQFLSHQIKNLPPTKLNSHSPTPQIKPFPHVL